MLIIGEKINASRKSIAAALADRDAEFIARTAVEQVAAGAEYIDLNGGDPREGMEAKNMAWLVETVQAATDAALAIDTADPEAMRTGLKMAGKKPILNSVSLEAARIGHMLPICGEFDCMVVALLMSDDGTPAGPDDRLARAGTLIEKLTAAGKKPDEIIIDPCFLPISAEASAGRGVIDAVAKIRRNWPDVHVGGGCSNISYGLPKRRIVNIAALAQAVYNGMDVGIIDPCAEGVMEIILAAEALAGTDEFCMNYVTQMK